MVTGAGSSVQHGLATTFAKDLYFPQSNKAVVATAIALNFLQDGKGKKKQILLPESKNSPRNITVDSHLWSWVSQQYGLEPATKNSQNLTVKLSGIL